MNPAFIILAIIFAVVVWLIMSLFFEPLGILVCKIWNNIKNKITKEEKGRKKDE